ncbi:MAG: hypothetical protein ACOC80_05010 [Petrotogales bacterium]
MRVKTLRTLRVRKDKVNFDYIPKGITYEGKNIPEVVLDCVQKKRFNVVQVLDWSGYDKLTSSSEKEDTSKKTLNKRRKK